MSPYPVAVSLVGATSAPAEQPRSWQLCDPNRFLRELFELIPCQPGLLVALVGDASGDQRLEAVVPVHWQPGDDHELTSLEKDSDECTELLRRAALKLWGRRSQRWRRPEHVFVTVVVRRGRVVHGLLESMVQQSWRFTNHLLPVFAGELALVTEHGWRCGFDDSCGATPALPRGDGG